MQNTASLRLVTIACSLLITACGATTGTAVPANATRILFVGNSYLYLHDIPGMVQELANSSEGTPMASTSIALPNYALIDHWFDGDAAREIATGKYQYVILQQGWTPAGVCRDTLRLAAQLFAERARPVNTTVAMFEAWAPASRQFQFPSTIGSYRQAAKDVGGVLLPIAEAWQLAIEQGVPVQLYEDDLHPTAVGSYIAALVIYARLTGRTPVGLPSSIRTASGQRVNVPADLAQRLQEAAATVALVPTPDEIPIVTPVITSRC